MTAVLSWTERARVFLETGPAPTDKTRETPLSSVLSVCPPPVSEKAGPAIPSPAGVEEARFIARRNRLQRWGWPQDEAEAMAHRLTLRDRSGDTRVSCTGCIHYQPGRCNNHRRAGLNVPAVGRDWASLLQHCPGHKETTS